MEWKLFMTRNRTRREFFQAVARAGAVAVSAPIALRQAAAPVCLAATGEPQIPADARMCVARWKPAQEPAWEDTMRMAGPLTEQAVAGLGGMSRFVKRGDVVWIKPNMGFDMPVESAANTHPNVVATLVRLCLEAGAKQVKVGDNSCYDAGKAYPMSGIESAAQQAGAEVVYLNKSKPKDMAINGERLALWPVFPEVVECDLLINVPVLKQHALTRVSSCMKNLMGTVGGPRHLWHRDMATSLTDIAAFLKPRLCITDAVRIITKEGPRGGDLDWVKFRGTVVASTDIVAAEAFGAEQIGLDPSESRIMARAQARTLGKIDYRGPGLREIEVAG